MTPIAQDKRTRKTQIRLRRSTLTESFLKDHGAWIDVIEFSGGLVRFADPSARPLHGIPITLWLDVTEISDLRSVPIDSDRIRCDREGCDRIVARRFAVSGLAWRDTRSIDRDRSRDLYCGTYCANDQDPID